MLYKKIHTFFQLTGLMAIGLLALYGLAMVFSSSPAWAAFGQALPDLQSHSRVPNVLTYQGMLRDTSGTPLDGTYEMTFRLYDDPVADDPVAGNIKHTEVISEVVVREGLFTVLLGDATSIDPASFAGPLYIGVKIGAEPEMVPRQRIAPVAYAVQLTDGVYVDGSGEVGIGTTDPQTQLDVNGDATITGKTMLNGALEVENNLTAANDLIVAGDATISGTLNIPRKYQVFWESDGSDPGPDVKDLGAWDICALMTTTFDQSYSDVGDEKVYCSITIDDEEGHVSYYFQDFGPVSESAGDRPFWRLYADAADFINVVECEAICLNFGP